MPFALCNTLPTFERLMELTLSGLNWKICLIYLDDVIVCGCNFYDALDRLKQVWQRICGTILKLTTCCITHNRVQFLGHYVSHKGFEVDPIKTAAVQDWPTHCTFKDVCALWGLPFYCKRYVPNFASVATPLSGFTKKDDHLVWDDDCEQPSSSLKRL